jgi:hypothetical protein
MRCFRGLARKYMKIAVLLVNRLDQKRKTNQALEIRVGTEEDATKSVYEPSPIEDVSNVGHRRFRDHAVQARRP